MAENQRPLSWVESADGWLAEVEQVAREMDGREGSLGATYRIRKHGSPPLFEMRWLWHPEFNYLEPEPRAEMADSYRQRHWQNPYLVREFGSLAEAMKDAHDTEHQRVEQRHRKPDGALEGIRLEFRSDIDGFRSVYVSEREADLEGWKIETVSGGSGTRSINQFAMSDWLAWAGWWEAPCDWGDYILRWIPPTE